MQQPLPILDHDQVARKLDRLAYEVFERNHDAPHLVLAGIADRGYLLARLIHERVAKLYQGKLELLEIRLDKDAPLQNPVSINNGDLQLLGGANVIVCDDVLYSGKTLAYACMPFLQLPVPDLQCLVLVKRQYLRYPVSTAYVGMALASTLQEHVSVQLVEPFGVILN